MCSAVLSCCDFITQLITNLMGLFSLLPLLCTVSLTSGGIVMRQSKAEGQAVESTHSLQAQYKLCVSATALGIMIWILCDLKQPYFVELGSTFAGPCVISAHDSNAIGLVLPNTAFHPHISSLQQCESPCCCYSHASTSFRSLTRLTLL